MCLGVVKVKNSGIILIYINIFPNDQPKKGVINTISSLFWLINLVVRTTGIFNNQQTFLLKIDDSSGSIMKDFFHGLICGGAYLRGGAYTWSQFCVKRKGGLSVGGLICGGAYLRSFTVLEISSQHSVFRKSARFGNSDCLRK